jgi:hypothetical protein
VRSLVAVGGGLALAAVVLVSSGTAVGEVQPPGVDRDDFRPPPGAVRTTQPMPTPGPDGPAFQSPGPSPRIVGGEPADILNHKYVVGIQTFFTFAGDSWVSTCTGTIVSPTKVLTAGHCTVDFPFGTTFVIAGRSDLNASGGYVARVASTWTHQSFNYRNLDTDVPVDDVSVLTLAQSLPDHYPSIPLDLTRVDTTTADTPDAEIVGFGVYNVTTGEYGVLHRALVPIKKDADCAADPDLGPGLGTDYNPTKTLCAGAPAPDVGGDSCHGDSGGPLLVAGKQVGIIDWGYDPCDTHYGVYERISHYGAAINADLVAPAARNLDWTGDGHTDLMGRVSNGDIYEYSGSGLLNDGHNGFSGRAKVGAGWNIYNKVLRVNGWMGVGTSNVIARDTSGNLWRYDNTGTGSFKPRVKIGTGWSGFNEIIAVNGFSAAGSADLLARKTNGDLMLYTSNKTGGWAAAGRRVGIGWGGFNLLLSPGSWKGDGKPSVIARKTNGDLMLYTGNGTGGWGGPAARIGIGWHIYNKIITPGDWNGDNLLDVMTTTSTGSLRLYTTNGKGAFTAPYKIIGTGWTTLNIVF